MTQISSYTTQIEKEDADGNISISKVTETRKIEKSTEPDFVKIYTKMWCEFNEIPARARDLFIEIALRMTYANSCDTEGGQLFYAIKPVNESICKTLGIKIRMYQLLLKDLVNCNALRRVGKGLYQVNPTYAGKGLWRYNPKYQHGGIEDIVAKFSFKDKSVDTQIIYADDGIDTELNSVYRQGLGVSKNACATLTYQEIKNKEEAV